MGFSVAVTPENFLYCLAGALLGTLVGVLPGLGPVTTIAMLLPFTFKLPAVASLIMLSGIYYGAHHSGSTTAIMLNMPGEPTSVVICIDGHPMARQGRAGAGAVHRRAGLVLRRLRRRGDHRAVLAAAGAASALLFGPAEYAVADRHGAGHRLGAVSASRWSRRSRMAALGVLLGTVGTDVNSGTIRFTFGADRARRRGELRRRRGRAVRLRRRDHPCRRAAPARAAQRQDHRPAADPGRPGGVVEGRSCAAPRSARASASCPAPGR